MNPKYRVRGLPQTLFVPESFGELKKKDHAVGCSLDRLLHAIPQPHVCDYIYDCRSLSDLARCWPTFSFLTPDRRFPTMKRAPLALAEYIDFALTGGEDTTSAIFREYQKQQAEKAALAMVLLAKAEKGEPSLDITPMALAIACHLFAGSPWLQANREKVESLVAESPVASFVALASGALGPDPQRLLDSIGREVSLVFELARSPGFARLIERAWFEHHLKDHPLYQSAWLHLNRNSKAAVTLLQSAAKRDGLCAATCLAMEPHRPEAPKWRKLAWETDEAVCWAGKIWMTANEDIQQFAHAGTATTRLLLKPQFYYHWLRDVDGDGIREKLSLLWPSPWAVELVVDLALSSDWVLDLCTSSKLEPEDLMESAVILWAAEYTNSTNEN